MRKLIILQDYFYKVIKKEAKTKVFFLNLICYQVINFKPFTNTIYFTNRFR